MNRVQAARYIGIGESSFHVLLDEGKLTRYAPTPKRVVFDREEIDRYILSRASKKPIAPNGGRRPKAKPEAAPTPMETPAQK